MQRAKVVQDFDQDLKEAISSVKKEEYRKAVDKACDLLDLNIIEHRIRTDFQLTQDDRLQLLGDIERVTALAS
jgi:ABC-type uncharacterized transport system ATPase subunit